MRGPAADRARAVDAAFAEALRNLEAGKLAPAERACRRLLDLAPRHAEGLNLQGIVCLRLGRLEAAAASLRGAIALAPENAQFHSNLGAVLRRAGRPEEAEQAFSRAIALAPDIAELHVNRAAALKELGRVAESLPCYERALALRPDYPEARHNLATALEALDRLDEAEAACRAALARRPDWAEAHYTLGQVLNRRLRTAEAMAEFRRAVELRPRHADALTRLAGTLLFYHRAEEAEALLRRSLELRPGHAETLGLLAFARRELGHPEEALGLLDRVIALEPEVADARLSRLMTTLPVCPATEAESRAAPEAFARELDRLEDWAAPRLAELGRVAGLLQPFDLAYRPGNHAPVLARHGALMARAIAARLAVPALGPPPARPRIRLVACTAHVRRHPVWDVVLRGIVDGLDRSRFEVVLYHTGQQADAETAWARARCDGFVQGPMPVRDWIARAAEDRPDILFYPEVGMDGAAFSLAALRLAPLQVAGWGHPVTTGLGEIDLFLSGALLEGPGAEAHYTERLVRLPGTGVCTALPVVAPEPADAAALDLPADRGVVRLVLPHMAHKFDPAHDALVAAAARAAAPCRLWIPRAPEYPWATERLVGRLGAALAAEGLDAREVLRVFPWQTPGGFLGLLDAMDLYLDAPGFSGYTTAWAALHRGLPVVTLEGEFLRQRLAGGLLRRIGRTEGLAATPGDYVARVATLAAEARDPALREARRAEIRAAAPAADGDAAPIRALEEVLVQALQERRGV